MTGRFPDHENGRNDFRTPETEMMFRISVFYADFRSGKYPLAETKSVSDKQPESIYSDIMIMRKSFITVVIIGLLFPCITLAASADSQFYQAESCYNGLIKSGKNKIRENRTPCIDMFREAYRLEPKGRYAAASLYMIGKSYRELYKYSSRASDIQEAVRHFQKIVAEFKKSNYIPLAKQALQEISSEQAAKDAAAKAKAAKDAAAKAKAAKEAEAKAKKASSVPKKTRDERYKESKEAFKAQSQSAISSYSQPSVPPETSPVKNHQATTISYLRFWSNPNYTRIVVDGDNETTYTHHLLNEDPSINKPQRLFIDFDNSRLGTAMDKPIPIDDNLLSNVRAGQYTQDKVRVVVDIKSFHNYKIFSLKNPFRVVLDVWGTDVLARTEPPKPPVKAEPVPQPPPKSDSKYPSPNRLAQQFALGVRKIVIDPGHGGHDPGAVGYSRNILEKDIVLSIAKKLERRARSQLGCEVIMTRSTDRYLSLEERTAIANTKNADLFISIHTNAAPDRNAYGVETYFLNLATDDESIRVAARENATTKKNISDLQAILNDLMKNAKINESSRLAAHVQKSVYSGLNKRYSQVKNKGVKQAPFYVLIGAQMPSILIETSFISNKRECERLSDSTYQDHIVDGIIDGIRNYIREINPTALFGQPETSG